MAGPELEFEVSAPAAEPFATGAFRSAVVAATRAGDDGSQRDALQEAAAAVIALADNGGESDLRWLLTPDPVNSNVTWTVACYQIGDLTPSAVRDFAEAVPAVQMMAACDDHEHIASELVASTAMGLRWVALVRTNTTVRLRLPDSDATSDSSGKHATELGDAQRRWRRRISAWAEGVELEPDTRSPEPPASSSPGRRPGRSSQARPTPVPRAAPPAESVVGLREQIAAIDQHIGRLDSLLVTGFGHDEERAGRLHALLSEVEARLVDASLDTRSGLGAVEQRVGDRLTSLRDTVVRGIDSAAANEAGTRDLVERRTTSLADQLRNSVDQLTERLASSDATIADLRRGLDATTTRLTELDERMATRTAQISSALDRSTEIVRAEVKISTDATAAGLGRLRTEVRQQLDEQAAAQRSGFEQLRLDVEGAEEATTKKIAASRDDTARAIVIAQKAITGEVAATLDATQGVAGAQETIAADIAAAQRAVAAARDALGTDIAAARDALSTEITAGRDGTATDIAAARDETAETIAAALDETSAEISATIAAAHDDTTVDLAAMRDETNARVAAARAEVTEHLTSTQDAITADIAAASDLTTKRLAASHADTTAKLASDSEILREGLLDTQIRVLTSLERLHRRLDELEATQSALHDSLLG